MCGRKDKVMSPAWSVLGGRSGIGQLVQESRWNGMKDGKGEELSSELPENDWLRLRGCVRAECRWSLCFFSSSVLFLAV